MKNLRVLFFVTFLISLVSCTHERLYLFSDKAIGFTVEEGADVRSAAMEEGKDFGWIGFASTGDWDGNGTPEFYNIHNKYDGSYISEKVYWPGYDNVSFFAYSPWEDQSNDSKKITLSADTRNGAPTIYFKTPTVSGKKYDLLAATNFNKSRENVELAFKHVLTQINFEAKLSKPADSLSIYIEKVRLNDVNVEGTYSYSSDDWTQGAITQDVLVYENLEDPIILTDKKVQDLKNEGDTLTNAYLIPQTVGAGQSCSNLTIYYWINKTRFIREIALPDATWLAGNHVKYSFTINPTDAELGINMEVVPWIEIENDMNLSEIFSVSTSTPKVETLMERHPSQLNLNTLWTNFYKDGNSSNTVAAADFGVNINSGRLIRIMISIINGDKLTYEEYSFSNIYKIEVSGNPTGSLGLDLAGLSNFVEGDILLLHFPGKINGTSPFYIKTGKGDTSFIGPDLDSDSQTKFKWLSRVYTVGETGELINATATSLTTDGGLTYSSISTDGYIVLKRTAKE